MEKIISQPTDTSELSPQSKTLPSQISKWAKRIAVGGTAVIALTGCAEKHDTAASGPAAHEAPALTAAPHPTSERPSAPKPTPNKELGGRVLNACSIPVEQPEEIEGVSGYSPDIGESQSSPAGVEVYGAPVPVNSCVWDFDLTKGVTVAIYRNVNYIDLVAKNAKTQGVDLSPVSFSLAGNKAEWLPVENFGQVAVPTNAGIDYVVAEASQDKDTTMQFEKQIIAELYGAAQ